MKAGRAAAVLCIVGAVASISTAQQTGPSITPEDIVSFRLASDPQISPDARAVAFVISEPADTAESEGDRNSDIWVVPATGESPPRRYAFGPNQETRPRWSPDGKYLAFLSDRQEKDKSQIYVMSTGGGEAEVITEMKEGVRLFHWDPDSRGMTFTAQDSLSTEEQKRNEAKDDERVVDEDVRQVRLYRIDIASREISLLTSADESVFDFDYSPDGSRIAIQTAATPELDDRYYGARLAVMNRDGTDRNVMSDKSYENIRWSPDGGRILFFAPVGRELTVLPGLISPDGGQTTLLGGSYSGTIWEMDWMPDGRELLVSSQEGVQGIIGRLDTQSGEVMTVASVGRSFGGAPTWSLSADGKWIAYLDASATSPPDVWIMRADGSDSKQLTHLNPQTASLAFGSVERVAWTSTDGTEIEGVLVKPADYVEGVRYPLVVHIHGGPEWGWWLGWQCSWHEWAQLLASNGFAVLLPNVRGSDGYGWQFVEKNYMDWGGGDFDDIMSGVDYLIEEGIADPDRLGIGGWSYGGFMTAWAVTQTDRFKAAVMGAGLSNLTSMYGTTDIPTFMQFYFDGYPYGRQQVYDDRSALDFVDRVRTPILILHGEADVRVPISQAYEFYQALKDMEVETRFVIYPREPHGIGERSHQIDVLQRVLDWYTTHLMTSQ